MGIKIEDKTGTELEQAMRLLEERSDGIDLYVERFGEQVSVLMETTEETSSARAGVSGALGSLLVLMARDSPTEARAGLVLALHRGLSQGAFSVDDCRGLLQALQDATAAATRSPEAYAAQERAESAWGPPEDAA